MMHVPFNRATVCGNEMAYVQEAVAKGAFSGDGPFTRKCEALLQEWFGSKQVLLTTSCTHALETAALALQFQPGDEVIIPAYTFVSTANAFALHGARPRFVDVRPDTVNLDESKLEAAITPRTRAIVPVHYAGVPCAMDAICSIAEARGIAVVEDNAHGIFGRYKGKPLGTFGCMAAHSFHDTKNITCGEGGALAVNEEQYRVPAEIIRMKGTNRAQFVRGDVDKYSWRMLGSSYIPADLLAAFLYGQLEQREKIQARRKEICEAYRAALAPWAERNGIALTPEPTDSTPTYHIFYVLPRDADSAKRLFAHLRERGVHVSYHYPALHLADMAQQFGAKPGDCPMAESIAERLIRLPLFYSLTDDEVAYVAESAASFVR